MTKQSDALLHVALGALSAAVTAIPDKVRSLGEPWIKGLAKPIETGNGEPDLVAITGIICWAHSGEAVDVTALPEDEANVIRDIAKTHNLVVLQW